MGVGMEAPSDALRRERFSPDCPGTWCTRCGSSLCQNTHAAAPNGVRRTKCTARNSAGMHGVVRLGAHDGALRDWIIAIKHNQWEAMGHALGRLLGQQIARCYRAEDLSRRTAVVVPIPMPWIRRVDRGIDHSAIIAAATARALKLRCVQPLGQRAHGTQLESSERTVRMQRLDRFGPRTPWRSWRARRSVQSRTVILVDDVRTTGATLAQASACLMRLGAAAVIPAVLSVKE